MPLIATTDYVTLAFIVLGLVWTWSLGRQNQKLREELRAERERDECSTLKD